MVPDGLVYLRSRDGFAATVERLAAAITAHGLTLFADIDHALAAATIGLRLRPTRVLIFGNPNLGTALMRACQVMGIDLPVKTLVWEDEAGTAWVTYKDPIALVRHYGMEPRSEPVVGALSSALRSLARAAADPNA